MEAALRLPQLLAGERGGGGSDPVFQGSKSASNPQLTGCCCDLLLLLREGSRKMDDL